MNTNETILGSLDPEIGEILATNASEIAQGRTTSSAVKAGLAMASIPIALAALSRDAFGQGTPTSVTGVLSFALLLEKFEYEFYSAVLGNSLSSAQNAVFATVRSKIPATALVALQQIQKHEKAHVAFLAAVPGVVDALSLTADSFDFTGNRGSATPGPFAAAGSDLPFLLLTAQGAEDTGVRAYKGQAPVLQATGDTASLEYALRIHSVEARHASKIRRLRRQTGTTSLKYSGTITGTNAGTDNITSPPAGAVAGLTAIYAGEDNTTQLGVSIASLPNLPTSNFTLASAASEAFDEPLTRAAVIAIVQGFFKPTIPG